MALRAKRRAFVEHYLRTFNGTESAKRAGYSARSAHVLAHRLLAEPSIQAAIKTRLAELKMGTDEVLLRLAEQARAEYAEYFGDDGTVDLAKILADDKGHLIKGTKWDRRGNLVVEFYDAQAALQLLGRAHGMFIDKTALTDPSGEYEYSGGMRDELERRLAGLAAGNEAPDVPGEPE